MIIARLILAFAHVSPKEPASDATSFEITQNANSSSGTHWAYELSDQSIIREKEYFESRHLFNFGPGYTQHWIFEVIGAGEVTIHWLKYTGGNDLDRNESYDIICETDTTGRYQLQTVK